MEILHKAKRIDTGEWVIGGSIIQFLDNGERTFFMPQFNEKCVCTHDAETDNILSFDNCIFYKVDPETVCIYTGKNDEKGKMIWLHDYVAFIDMESTESGYSEYQCAGEVVWDEETASFQVTNRLSAESYEILDECTVIGNSFDNPDMLEDY